MNNPAEINTPPNLPSEHLFGLHKDLLIAALQKQFDYGKWLLASLLAVHLGALLVISQAGEASKGLFEAAGAYLIYGVAAALVSGGFAWINFSAASIVYAQRLQAFIDGRKHKPSPLSWLVVGTTFIATPIVVIISLALFFFAARSALASL